MARPLKQIDARQVKALAEIGCTIGEIAAVTGAGKRTIETRFRAAIHQGQEWRNVSVRRMAFRAARKGSRNRFVITCIVFFSSGMYV